MEQELFEQAHDLSNHGGYYKCHERLAHTVYIRHLSRNLKEYIAHCPACQLNQTKQAIRIIGANCYASHPISNHLDGLHCRTANYLNRNELSANLNLQVY